MIKINLYKKAQDQLAVKKIKSGSDLNLELFSDDQIHKGKSFASLIPKILIILLIPGILRAYSFYKITTLNRHKKIEQEKLDDILKINRNLREKNQKFKRDKARADVHKNKLLIFKKIASQRLDEVKTLDFLQEAMVDGVWLKSIRYNNKDYSLKLLGLGDTDDTVNTFVERLEKFDFFKEVYLTSTKEKVVDKVAIKSFEINSKITPNSQGKEVK